MQEDLLVAIHRCRVRPLVHHLYRALKAAATPTVGRTRVWWARDRVRVSRRSKFRRVWRSVVPSLGALTVSRGPRRRRSPPGLSRKTGDSGDSATSRAILAPTTALEMPNEPQPKGPTEPQSVGLARPVRVEGRASPFDEDVDSGPQGSLQTAEAMGAGARRRVLLVHPGSPGSSKACPPPPRVLALQHAVSDCTKVGRDCRLRRSRACQDPTVGTRRLPRSNGSDPA